MDCLKKKEKSERAELKKITPNNKLYLRAGQKEGYTEYQGGHPWGSKGYSKVIVENTIRPVDMRNWFNDAQNLEEIVNPQNLMEMTDVERLACAEEWLNGAAGLLQANAAQEGDGQ